MSKCIPIAVFRCYVTEVGEDEFTAEIWDNTIGVFSIEKVFPRDRHLIKLGAIFYLSVGRKNGREFCGLRFSRDAWTDEEIARLHEMAKYSKLNEVFGV